ncbi:hypothetical protein MBLNU230_g1384t1 [Neophaeotheca triangularis]
MSTNGTSAEGQSKPLNRADVVDDLVTSVQQLLIPFIRRADEDAAVKHTSHGLQIPGAAPRSVLVEHHPPQKLDSILAAAIAPLDDLTTVEPQGKPGLLAAIEQVLHHSVNTWDQGFLDKLYAATTPTGVVADLVLSVLNTNLHVYQVSPALTVIEKRTSKALAHMFGLRDKWSGGVSQPGGSAANQMAMVVARNNLFPETKSEGLGARKFVLFTSAHGHYSLEKAAQIMGFGSGAVKTVAVDDKGCMKVSALREGIRKSREQGETPFFVNATAGTTVLGSYDPLEDIAAICKEENVWMHVDGSWGAPAIFSRQQAHKLRGSHLADSIALCPHKMMGVPCTCTFLLGKDMRKFHAGMTLPAGYLFHNPGDEDADNDAVASEQSVDNSALDAANPSAHPNSEADHGREVWDLADLTPQCGRRGDSLKLALSWIYQGTVGFENYINKGFTAASHLASLVQSHPSMTLVSQNPPPCLQVCFYYGEQIGEQGGAGRRNRISKVTEEVSKALMVRGFMIDYAPGEEGKFFRVVVNGQTELGTVEGLVKAVAEVGEGVVGRLR